jgi:hypothetical protein
MLNSCSECVTSNSGIWEYFFHWTTKLLNSQLTNHLNNYTLCEWEKKKRTNALIIQCIDTQHSPTCLSTLECHYRGVKTWSCWDRCPMPWEAKMDESCILYLAASWLIHLLVFSFTLRKCTVRNAKSYTLYFPISETFHLDLALSFSENRTKYWTHKKNFSCHI